MVGGRDEVLLDGPGVVRVGHLAGEHVQVVGGVGQVGVGVDRLEALVEAVQGHDQGRHDRAGLHGVGPQLLLADVEPRLEVEGVREQRVGGAEGVEGDEVLAGGGDGGQQVLHRRRDVAQRPDLLGEGLPLGRAGKVALVEEVPDVLQRHLLGQLDGVVLAVVVEALLAPDVADFGLGHDHAFEPAAGFDRPGMLHPQDLGQAQHVPDGHQADQLALVDDGEVAVAVGGEVVERRQDRVAGRDRAGVRRHPVGHRRRSEVGTGRRRSDQVALGEDSHRLAGIDDDHRSDAPLDHACRRLGQGIRRRSGQHVLGHDLAHRTYFGSVSHPTSSSQPGHRTGPVRAPTERGRRHRQCRPNRPRRQRSGAT